MTDEIVQRRPVPRVFSALMGAHWLILPDALDQIVEIVARENTFDPEALLGRYPDRMKGTRTAQITNGVGILPVIGPIVPRADLFTEISGATSADRLAADFGVMLRDPEVAAIVLNIDSPGGAASGIADLAALIASGRGTKPIKAYVGGTAASAAYWIATGADEIVVSSAGMVGSVGVVATLQRKDGKAIEIVSSQSPYKRADPATKEGRAEWQRIVDELAAVFVETVAENRGVSVSHVLERFGAGSMRIGQDAVAASMADRVGTLEQLIASVSNAHGNNARGKAQMSKKTAIEIAAEHPEAAEALRAEGFKQGRAEGHAAGLTESAAKAREEGIAEGRALENARQMGIRKECAIAGHEALVDSLLADTSISVEAAALRVLAAEKSARETVLANIKSDATVVAQIAAVAPAVAATVAADAPVEERCAAKWNADASIRDEFGTLAAYTAYVRNYEAGRIRVKSDR